jgi:hypothetical protein
MKRGMVCVAGVAALVSACENAPTANSLSDDLMSAAFASVPAGFSLAQSSYSSTADSSGNRGPGGGPFGDARRGGHGRGGFHLGLGFGPGGLGLMGGLAPEFHGGGDARGRGPFGAAPPVSTCTYSSTSGRVACDAQAVNGLTIVRSIAYTNATGQPQSEFDTLTTNSVNETITVAGTTTGRDSAKRVVSHVSDRTVTGLAAGSTRRTVSGTSAGQETSTGTRRDTAFTSVRVAGDTITGVIVPVSTSGPSYPTAGRVIRRMKVTLTRAGQTTTSDRREVITYDGSATAKLEGRRQQ